jgi:hypothetical protein
MTTRHQCPSCRLTKCFTNGMQIEMIRSSQSKTNKINRTRKRMTKSTGIISTTSARFNKDEQVLYVVYNTCFKRLSDLIVDCRYV